MKSGESTDSLRREDDDEHTLFVRLLAASHRRLLGYLVSLLGRREDAEDVLQKASVTMWRKFGTFEAGTDFLAWACTVCFYEARNFQRLAARSRLCFSDALVEMMAAERQADLARQDERMDALEICLEKLDESGRRLIEAAYREETAIQELARQTGRAPQTLYNKLHVLRRLLAECIQQSMREVHP